MGVVGGPSRKTASSSRRYRRSCIRIPGHTSLCRRAGRSAPRSNDTHRRGFVSVCAGRPGPTARLTTISSTAAQLDATERQALRQRRLRNVDVIRLRMLGLPADESHGEQDRSCNRARCSHGLQNWFISISGASYSVRRAPMCKQGDQQSTANRQPQDNRDHEARGKPEVPPPAAMCGEHVQQGDAAEQEAPGDRVEQ